MPFRSIVWKPETKSKLAKASKDNVLQAVDFALNHAHFDKCIASCLKKQAILHLDNSSEFGVEELERLVYECVQNCESHENPRMDPMAQEIPPTDSTVAYYATYAVALTVAHLLYN